MDEAERDNSPDDPSFPLVPQQRVRFKVMRCRFGLIRFGTEQTDGWRGYDR